jgi:hypothetical protein
MHVPSASFRTHQVPPEQLPPETQGYAPAAERHRRRAALRPAGPGRGVLMARRGASFRAGRGAAGGSSAPA